MPGNSPRSACDIHYCYMSRELEPDPKSGINYGKSSEHKSLREQPDLYPGRSAEWHYVYQRGRIWQVTISENQRLSKARIVWQDSGSRTRSAALPNLFLRWGATDVIQRVPLLAIGSNAYPRQLFDKLNNVPIDDSMLVVRGVVQGLEIVFCPFLSVWEYIPVTPRHREGVQSIAWLQLVSVSQLLAIAKTERNYKLVYVPNDVARFTIDQSGECVEGFYVFWHPGWLGMFEGDLPPISAGTLTGEDVDAETRSRVRSQDELLDDIRKRVAGASPENEETVGREELQAALATMVVSREWPKNAIVSTPSHECRRYGDLVSRFRTPVNDRAVLVRRSGPIRDPAGDREILICLSPSLKSTCRLGKHAVVYTRIGNADSPSATPRLLALPALTVAESGPEPPRHGAGLDQMARTALGLWPGEYCSLAPLSVPWSRRAEVFVGRIFSARSFAARSVKASEFIMERPICWMDRGLLTALGVDEGGYVVVSAAAPVAGSDPLEFQLRSRRLQALATTSEHYTARIAVLHPQDPDARYPDPAEILGVSPDLPWLWIDEQTRAVLGLRQHDTLSPVVVRPSVRYLFFRMGSRFVLATIGIGAGIALLANQIVKTVWKDAAWLGVEMGQIVAAVIMIVVFTAATIVIVWNARR